MTLKELMQLCYNSGQWGASPSSSSDEETFSEWWEKEGRERRDTFMEQLDDGALEALMDLKKEALCRTAA